MMREAAKEVTAAVQQEKQAPDTHVQPVACLYACVRAVDRALQLQRIIGNRAMQGILRSWELRGKLDIGQWNGVYKPEASRVAGAATCMLTPAAGASLLQRRYSECDEELPQKPRDDDGSDTTKIVQCRKILPESVAAASAPEVYNSSRRGRENSLTGLAESIRNQTLAVVSRRHKKGSSALRGRLEFFLNHGRMSLGSRRWTDLSRRRWRGDGDGFIVQRQDDDEAQGNAAVPAPQESFLFAEMPEGVTWHHPNNPRHPAEVRREGQTLRVSFVGRFEGQLDPVVLPGDVDLEVYRVAFTGTLHVTMQQRGVELGGKAAVYTVDKFGNTLLQRYDEFYRPGQEADESRRQLFTGLTVTVTAGAVTYGHKTGGLKLSFDRATGKSVITDVVTGGVLFDGAKAGFPRTLDVRVSDAGTVDLVLAAGSNAVKLDFKLANTAAPAPVSSEFDVAMHDRLVAGIESYNVDVQEEGRLIPDDALDALKRILDGMRPDVARALREQGAVVRFSLADHVSESRQEKFFLRVGGMTTSRVESGAFPHEFAHMLFQLAGLRTDELDPGSVSDELREDMKRAVGEGRAADPEKALRMLSTDSRLNRIWLDMFQPLDPKQDIPSFILPPEPMIIHLASEKNYGQRTLFAEAGHPEDNVNEFVASYVNLATLMRDRFVAAVLAAKAARVKGRERPQVTSLFRDTWSIVSERMVDLGKNPF
jgi:hypothetical protein